MTYAADDDGRKRWRRHVDDEGAPPAAASLPCGESAGAAADEVFEASRRGHHDLGATAQRAHLPADRHSAHQRGQPQLHGAGVRGECVGDLLRQLTCGYENQPQRLACLGTLPGRTGQQRQPEGEGISEPVLPVRARAVGSFVRVLFMRDLP
jgi:hypothetical protein